MSFSPSPNGHRRNVTFLSIFIHSHPLPSTWSWSNLILFHSLSSIIVILVILVMVTIDGHHCYLAIRPIFCKWYGHPGYPGFRPPPWHIHCGSNNSAFLNLLRERFKKKKLKKKLTNVSFMYVCVARNGEMLVFFLVFSPNNSLIDNSLSE